MKIFAAILFSVSTFTFTTGIATAADSKCKSGYEWNSHSKKCERVSSY